MADSFSSNSFEARDKGILYSGGREVNGSYCAFALFLWTQINRALIGIYMKKAKHE
jgi:hypothetical protein